MLIGQDGLQLPPLSFASGSLLPFLTCLEQGLVPNGRFDPPLNLAHFKNNPQIRRNILSEKIAKMSEEKDQNASQDFVFRIINVLRASSIGMLYLVTLFIRIYGYLRICLNNNNILICIFMCNFIEIQLP